MKRFFLIIFIVTFFSCKKETDNIVDTSLPEQNLANVSFGMDAAQKMDLYLPAGRTMENTKLIILVHGGGWVSGDKADFATFVPTLKQRLPGYAIANINYRLANSLANHFPTQEMDMKAAVDFLSQKSTEYHISQTWVLLGASAGGHLATLYAYKYKDAKIKAVVDFYGPVDIAALYNTSTDPFFQHLIESLMNGTPSSNQELYEQSSPIKFVTAQSPPTIILHGSADELVKVDQSIALQARLQSLNVVNQLVIYSNQGHDIWPPSIMNDAFDKIETFIKTNVQ